MKIAMGQTKSVQLKIMTNMTGGKDGSGHATRYQLEGKNCQLKTFTFQAHLLWRNCSDICP
jgi:hypothetical protein